MSPKIQYKILRAMTLDDIEEETQELLRSGWQPAGPVTQIDSESSVDATFHYIHEMIKVPAPDQLLADEEVQRLEQMAGQLFEEKKANMNPKVRDLLEINGIELFYANGQPATRVGDKVHNGINPNEVLNALKASKHCPLDLDEESVLKAVGELV